MSRFIATRSSSFLLATVALCICATSPAAIAGPGKNGLYIYGTPQGCLVQLKAPLKQDEYATWDGACKVEYADGNGKLTIFDGAGRTVSSSMVTMERGVAVNRWPVKADPTQRTQDAPGTWSKASAVF